ncbi:MAG: hypothetical protein AAF250_06435 [Pseudomonadota bacterium]
MDRSEDIPQPQLVTLDAGAQAVINGALVTAIGPCRFEVGSGVFVLTGNALHRGKGSLRNPREELYFSMLEASAGPERFAEARLRLFRLLAEVVAQDRTHQGQRECALCAAALMAGKASDAVRSAARIAADRQYLPRGGRAPSFRDTDLLSKAASA